MLEQQIAQANACVDAQAPELTKMADTIFDHPEIGPHEVFASKLLTDYLEAHGFTVTRGVGGLDGKTGKGDPIWGSCVNMMPCRAWAMDAAIRCRDRGSWGLPWPSRKLPEPGLLP